MKTFWRDNDSTMSIASMIALLEGAELIVCYNGFGFDFPVIKKHYRSTEQYNAHLNKTHDIFTRVREVLGYWPKLDALLKSNNLELKTADGLEAIKMWEEGRRDELQAYCEADVRQCTRLALLPAICVPEGGSVSNHIGGIASALVSVRHSKGLQ
jgi:DEAD/DEAH box helicase domain-containing protein